MLGSKTLGLNILEFHYVILANHYQNLESKIRLLKVCICVKLESSVLQDWLCKSARLDRLKTRLSRTKLVQIFFLQNFPTQAQACIMCRILCFALSIKGKTLATFYSSCLCCVYESLVRSKGVFVHTYLGFLISRSMSRTWWSLQLLHKELKENTSGSTCGCCEFKKEVVHGLGAVT